MKMEINEIKEVAEGISITGTFNLIVNKRPISQVKEIRELGNGSIYVLGNTEYGGESEKEIELREELSKGVQHIELETNVTKKEVTEGIEEPIDDEFHGGDFTDSDLHKMTISESVEEQPRIDVVDSFNEQIADYPTEGIYQEFETETKQTLGSKILGMFGSKY